jgi:hypothetical protein
MRWRCWSLVDPHAGVPVSCGDAYPVDGHFVFPRALAGGHGHACPVSPWTPPRRADPRHAVDLLHDVLADGSEAR